MQPEPEAQAREWLIRAVRELTMAEQALRGPVLLPEMAAYHAQQAAARALKGYLASRDVVPPKTHDLVQLLELCRGYDEEFALLSAAAETLNPYATQFRYPGGPLEPELAVAQQAIEMAAGILRFAQDRAGNTP